MPDLPEGAARVDCIEVECAECGEELEVDAGNPHFRPDDDLAHELSSFDWHIVGDRVLCPDCSEAANSHSSTERA